MISFKKALNIETDKIRIHPESLSNGKAYQFKMTS